MSYLVIQNEGEIEEKAFELMGASDKRGSAEKVGMFGTGSKYGIATLLREDIKVIAYSGETKIKFGVQPTTFRGKEYRQVTMAIGNRVPKPLSFTAEMGLHWGTEEAIRELVSNAYDEGKGKVYIAGRPEGEKGITRIFVEYLPAVQTFYRDKYDDWFTYDRVPLWREEGYAIYRKIEDRAATYRRGVRTWQKRMPSLYDYQIDGMEVREDRTSDYWEVLWRVAQLIDKLPKEHKKKVLSFIQEHPSSLEGEASVKYSLSSPEWKEIVKDDYQVVTTAQVQQTLQEELSHFKTLIVPEGWASKLEELGVPAPKDILNSTQLKGYRVIPPSDYSEAEREFLSEVIKFLTEAGYPIGQVNGLNVFESSREDITLGEYDREKDEIFLNRKTFLEGRKKVAEILMEEWAHRESGATDKTRQFQNYLITQIIDQASQRLERYL